MNTKRANQPTVQAVVRHAAAGRVQSMKSELIFVESQAFALKTVWRDAEERVKLLRQQIAAEQHSMPNASGEGREV